MQVLNSVVKCRFVDFFITICNAHIQKFEKSQELDHHGDYKYDSVA